MKIEIDKELFQWEKKRYINFSYSGTKPSFFLFYNSKSRYGFEVFPQNNQAQIPDSLLKEALPITVEACVGEPGEGQVISRRIFKVLKRVKPENYVDSEEIIHIIYDGGEEI